MQHSGKARQHSTTRQGSPSTTTPTAAARQWTLNATSISSRHRSCTTSLDEVVNETADVAEQTLDRLYHQGQQIQHAAHGIEQIDENVQHSRRIITFMSRFCCFRSDTSDPDIELERHWRTNTVERQSMARVVAADCVEEEYAAKRRLVGAVLAKSLAAAGPAAVAAAASTAADAVAAGKEPWSELIAAVPGPLGRERARRRSSMPMLGHGIEERELAQLQAETAKQDCYLDGIDSAMDKLHAMGLAIGQELDEQAPNLDALQHRVEDTGEGLRSVASGAAKLAGSAPRRGTSASSWHGERDAATQVVSRAMADTAPLVARYSMQ